MYNLASSMRSGSVKGNQAKKQERRNEYYRPRRLHSKRKYLVFKRQRKDQGGWMTE